MTRSITRSLLVTLALAAAVLVGDAARLFGGGGIFNNRSVGGVAIDAEGVVEAPTVQDQRQLEQLREQTELNIPAALDKLKGAERAAAMAVVQPLNFATAAARRIFAVPLWAVANRR